MNSHRSSRAFNLVDFMMTIGVILFLVSVYIFIDNDRAHIADLKKQHDALILTGEQDKAYARGVNDALDGIALHEMERNIFATMGTPDQRAEALKPMTWGERGEVVAKRLGVERTK